MLEHEGVGLHNVVELEPAPGGGQLLRRWPQHVRKELGNLGRMVSQESCGAEIRFVTESPNFRLMLSSEPSVLAPWEMHNQDVFVFRGPFLHAHHRLTPGRTNFVDVINIAAANKFAEVKPASQNGCGFAPQVWRVLIGRFPAIFLGLNTFDQPHRAPTFDEIPKSRWLAYGSSITAGAGATLHHGSYIYHAARAAGLDVYNCGLSGSCACELRVAEYLASRDDWDAMTLEIGVNMRSGYSAEGFDDRARGLVDAICRRHPNKPVVLITIYPNSASIEHAADASMETARRQAEFDQILRRLVESAPYPNLHLIEGKQVLDRFDALTTDLIHPSDYGHARMGQFLGRRLQTILNLAK